MPCEYEVDAARRLVRLRLSGNATVRERAHCVSDILKDGSLVGKYHVLIDASRATSTPVEGDIDRLSKLIVDLHSKLRGRIAIVNARPGHSSVSKVISMYTDVDDRQVRVYPEESQAMAWLSAA